MQQQQQQQQHNTQQQRHQRSRAAASGRAAPLALLAVALLAAASLPGAAAVKGISTWTPGLVTHFGGAQDGMDPSSLSFGTKEGSCGYGVIPKDKYPYFSTAALSLSNPFSASDELKGCGQCFQIQCADKRSGVCKTDSAGKPLSVMVMISDSCPECGTHHIDTQSLTFAKLADPGIGRIDVQYRRVECTPPDDIKVSVMDFRGAGGWIRLSIDDTGGRAAVKAVSVKGATGDWRPLTNSWGASWETSSAPPPPLSFKIVGDDDEEVIATDVIKQAGGISGGAFADRATFSAGVQFSISDPAFGMVQAFDGPSDPMLITSSTPGNDAPGGAAPGAPAGPADAPSDSSQGGAQSTPASVEPSSKKSAGGCSDVPTPDGHSCEQQKAWGKCSESFIKTNKYCAATCGLCGSGTSQPAVQAMEGPSDGSKDGKQDGSKDGNSSGDDKKKQGGKQGRRLAAAARAARRSGPQ